MADPGAHKHTQEVVAIIGTQHAHRFVLDSVALDLPELQGDPEEVAKEKCRMAAQKLRCAGLGAVNAPAGN